MARRPDIDDDAPWLAEASARPQTRVTRRSLFWTIAILLALTAVAAVGLVLLLSKKGGGSTQGYMTAEEAPLISAEPGPYKVPPADPKGLAVEGQDQTLYAAGAGIDQASTIDQSAVPEAPLPRPGSEAAEPPVPAPAPAPGPPRDLLPKAPVAAPTPAPAATGAAPPVNAVPPSRAAPNRAPATPPVAAPAPTGVPKAAPPASAAAKPAPQAAAPASAMAKPAKGGTVQLGAFSSEDKAEAAWAGLIARHPALAGFGKRVSPIESNGQTLWRLRASGGDAAALCASLTAAGAACKVVE